MKAKFFEKDSFLGFKPEAKVKNRPPYPEFRLKRQNPYFNSLGD
jgi:hypothetical protein